MARKKASTTPPKVPTPEPADAPKEPKGRPGRPRKVPPNYVEALGTDHTIVRVPLSRINLADETFKFRHNLRIGDLIKSITEHGQQLPVILRQVDGAEQLQVISGFRRLTSIQEIGWAEANAIILTDVTNDHAFRISVLENEARKTYNDLDRANAIWKYRAMGYEVGEIAESMFKLSRKQLERIQGLTTLPAVLQDAIGREKGFTTTHASVLKQLAAKSGERQFPYEQWVDRVEGDKLSVAKMREEVLGAAQGSSDSVSLFSIGSDKDTGAGFLRFKPVRINLETMTDKEKEGLVAQLRSALGL